MSNVGANAEDVPFDFSAADRLVARFRATASELTIQMDWRNSLAGVARQEWRGLYAEKFDVRTGLCRDGARMLADSMTAAAVQVEELARQAREEQSRRAQARQWFAAHQPSNPLEWIWHSFEDWWSGPDVPPAFRSGTPAASTVALSGPIPANRG